MRKFAKGWRENFRGRCARLRINKRKRAGNPMRAYIPAYDLRIPGSLSEALALLGGETGVWQPFAGGTDLMVLLEAGKLFHKRFLSVAKLDDLRGIELTSADVTLAALTTYTEIQNHHVLQKEFPLLSPPPPQTRTIPTQH